MKDTAKEGGKQKDNTKRVKGRAREREGKREKSLGLHGLLSQHCGADRTAAAHTDIYSCHARLPLAGPRRPLTPGLTASPSLKPLNITSLNHPTTLVLSVH